MRMHLEAMKQVLSWFLFTLAIAVSNTHTSQSHAAVSNMQTPSTSAAPRPGCPSMCGDVHIPYPFGIGEECAWRGQGPDKYFTVSCNHSYNPPRPIWGTNVEIIDISLEKGEMRVYSPVSYICYNSTNTTEPDGVSDWELDYTDSPLLISPTRNEFTAIGCDALALLEGKEDWSYYTGCISSCVSLDSAAQDGEVCTGLGCCQTSISTNLSMVNVRWRSGNKTRRNLAWKYSPCSYAFVGEKGWYKFSRRDLVRNGNNSFASRAGERTIPLVLDWAIRRDGSCWQPRNEDGEPAKPVAPACVSAHSYCVDAPQGDGYQCKCSPGYQGNPYVTGHDGCTNINECELRKSNPAKYEILYPCHSRSTCQDTPGDYKCTCKFGQRGDGKSDKGCQPIFPVYAIPILVVPIVVLLACFWTLELKRRKHRRFFDQNGGEILSKMEVNIYTRAQLKKITNGYKEIIGQGAFGKVYKGITDGGKEVAVKCSTAAALPKEEFANEITFKFQLNHANLVRLVGCCLETEVPMLVYEFVRNGSLYNVLHGTERPALSLQVRLDIAIGSAEALGYMHSHGDRVHGDVKSANILLTQDWTPKVSDFGSSKLLANSKYVLAVAGDRNYIDPVYFQTDRFTAKSDVYSFGVVLLELITRKTVKYDDDNDNDPLFHKTNNSLPINFVKSCRKEGSGRTMYDIDILSDGEAEYHVQMERLGKIGELAVRCLNEDEDERPTMAEVVKKLREVKQILPSGGQSSVAN